jgi:hypothetical protein
MPLSQMTCRLNAAYNRSLRKRWAWAFRRPRASRRSVTVGLGAGVRYPPNWAPVPIGDPADRVAPERTICRAGDWARRAPRLPARQRIPLTARWQDDRSGAGRRPCHMTRHFMIAMSGLLVPADEAGCASPGDSFMTCRPAAGFARDVSVAARAIIFFRAGRRDLIAAWSFSRLRFVRRSRPGVLRILLGVCPRWPGNRGGAVRSRRDGCRRRLPQPGGGNGISER